MAINTIHFFALIALHIYHAIRDRRWTPFWESPSKAQQEKAKARLKIHAYLDKLWQELEARPPASDRLLTEYEAEEALHCDRERWQWYKKSGLWLK